MRKCRPQKGSSGAISSIRSSWLYLARRSERQGAPVFRWPAAMPTATSANQVSSVSPERWLTNTPQPLSRQSFQAASDSESVPIWLILSSMAFVAFISTPFWTRSTFVV